MRLVFDRRRISVCEQLKAIAVELERIADTQRDLTDADIDQYYRLEKESADLMCELSAISDGIRNN